MSVAERLLSKSLTTKPLRLLGFTLSLQSCSQSSDSDLVVRGRCVLVSGITRDVDVDEEIVPLLENKRKGGGAVEKAERLADDTVLVTFVEQSGNLRHEVTLYLLL